MIPAVRALARAAMAARPVPLADVQARAELLTRVDRGYLVPVEVFAALAAELTDRGRPGGPFAALCVNGRRWFGYRCVHHDTSDLRSFHDHRQRRRPRFTVSERLYEDTGERQLEVELTGRRGETVKHRRPLLPDEAALGAAPRGFLASVLDRSYGIAAPADLRPVLATHHQRATLVADGRGSPATRRCCAVTRRPGGRYAPTAAWSSSGPEAPAGRPRRTGCCAATGCTPRNSPRTARRWRPCARTSPPSGGGERCGRPSPRPAETAHEEALPGTAHEEALPGTAHEEALPGTAHEEALPGTAHEETPPGGGVPPAPRAGASYRSVDILSVGVVSAIHTVGTGQRIVILRLEAFAAPVPGGPERPDPRY